MNDIRTPRRLPSPQPPQRLGSVKSVPPAPPTPAPQQEHSSGPLRLPAAVSPQGTLKLPRPKRRWVKWLLVSVGVLLLAAIGTGMAGYFWYKDALRPLSANEAHIKVVVEQGANAEQVATTLEQKKVIKSSLALQLYMRLRGKGNIKAGTYVFSPHQQPAEIVQWLNEGRVDTLKITIVPGRTLAEIKQGLIKDGFTAEAVDAAYAKQYSHAILSDRPAGAPLEGYIFPETYFATPDATVDTIITSSFDEFEKQVTKNNLRQKLEQQGLSLFQGATLASIVEKEAKHSQDKRQVAQVFLKRLRDGAHLGSDPTYRYAAGLLGVEPTPAVDSPYNTYKTVGLPPGPIGNFTIETLKAVADPAPGDYLYFLAGDDGITHFAHTFEEHQANIRQFCQKLCSTF